MNETPARESKQDADRRNTAGRILIIVGAIVFALAGLVLLLGFGLEFLISSLRREEFNWMGVGSLFLGVVAGGALVYAGWRLREKR